MTWQARIITRNGGVMLCGVTAADYLGAVVALARLPLSYGAEIASITPIPSPPRMAMS